MPAHGPHIGGECQAADFGCEARLGRRSCTPPDACCGLCAQAEANREFSSSGGASLSLAPSGEEDLNHRRCRARDMRSPQSHHHHHHHRRVLGDEPDNPCYRAQVPAATPQGNVPTCGARCASKGKVKRGGERPKRLSQWMRQHVFLVAFPLLRKIPQRLGSFEGILVVNGPSGASRGAFLHVSVQATLRIPMSRRGSAIPCLRGWVGACRSWR